MYQFIKDILILIMNAGVADVTGEGIAVYRFSTS